MNLRIALPALGMTLGLLVLAACSKVTSEHYAQVEAGMSREQVYALLGKPDEVNGSAIGRLEMSAEVWESSDYRVAITFVGDKVTLKSIGKAGEHEE